MQLSALDNILEIAKNKPRCRVAVAAADDEHVLEAIDNATKLGLIAPIFIGRKSNIQQLICSYYSHLAQYPVIETLSDAESAMKAAQLVSENKADTIMKGLLPTATLLKGILHFKNTLSKSRLLSHLAIFELPAYPKLLGVTDAALNIAPTRDEKLSIAINAINAFIKLGITKPNVALISAIEKVNPKIPSTIDAEEITKILTDYPCIAEGPLALDNAISKESAKHKGIHSKIAGEADILVLPDMVSGNVLYKALNYFAQAKCGAIVLGAKAPIILTSRSDSAQAKLYSLALAVALT